MIPRRRLDSPAPWPAYPQEIPRRPTARCRPRRWRASGRGRSAFYVHVPFCATRCGYCDFNTYVPGEQGAEQAGGYVGAVLAEIDLAARVLGDGTLPRVDTVFFGGGTPTLLPAGDLARILRRIDERFGLAPGAEVTTEANPESVDPGKLAALREAGFTRLSLGMQSAVPRVLAILDRVHTPGRPQQAVAEARAAGFEQVSLDLIYGTPGETADDWRGSLDAALSAEPDHLSTYSLIVEPGTRMAAQVRRGELVVPGEDVIVDRFETAERVLADAGMAWYETCSWATRRGRLVPAQPRLLARRRLVGRRAGRAQPRRRRALVERAAPAGVERAARGRRRHRRRRASCPARSRSGWSA